MLISRVHLALSNGTESSIARCTNGALNVVIDSVQTAFVEGVFAQEMYCREIKGSATGLAAAGLEDGGLGGEGFEFLLFGCGFGFVA